MGIESVFPRALFPIGGISVRNTVVQSWIIIAVLLAAAGWTSGKFRSWEPRPWQLLVEYLIDFVRGLIRDIGGRDLPGIVPYLTTMITYIALSNLLSLIPGLSAPTRDINTTLALSLLSLGSVWAYGIKHRGLGAYLHSFIEPVPLLLPLNLLGQLSRMLSMTLRLFGNIIAGEMINAVMYLLVPVLGPLPTTALGTITAVLQALVFTVLTLVFLVDARGEDAEQPTSLEIDSEKGE